MTSAECLYNLVIHGGLPLGVLGHYWAFEDRDPDWHTVFRFIDTTPDLEVSPDLWIHGASVGEMQLVDRIRGWTVDHGVEPRKILITTQTRSGLESIDHPTKRLLPADYPRLLSGLFHEVDDTPLIVVETELWPNLFRGHAGPIHVFNGHLKRDTFENYCRFKSLFRSTLRHCDSILARSDQEARRFRVLTGNNSRTGVSTGGNLKWTKLLSGSTVESLDGPEFTGDDPVVVAGSTWPGEERRLLEWLEDRPAKIYLAPRHMDRLDDVKSLLETSGHSWTTWTGSTDTVEADVVLVDTIGILSDLYGRADLVFVGGSLVEDVGGHDVLEPARFGAPIGVGPNISNIRESTRRLEEAGLLAVVESKSDWKDLYDRAISGTGSTTFSDAAEDVKNQAKDIEQRYKNRLYSLLESTGSR